MILFPDTFPPKYQDRTNVTKNQTSHDTFGWYSTPKYQDSSIEMVVFDTFGPKYRERHFDTFYWNSRDAWTFLLFIVLSDGNAGSIPAWDIYFRWPYAIWKIPYRTVRYRTVQTTSGQRKYMPQAGIEPALPSLNTVNIIKVPRPASFSKKYQKWRSRYFGPKASRTTISILESWYFGVEYQPKVSCEVWFFVPFVRSWYFGLKVSVKSIMWSLV